MSHNGCMLEKQGIVAVFLGKCFGNWQKGGRGFVWWEKQTLLTAIHFF